MGNDDGVGSSEEAKSQLGDHAPVQILTLRTAKAYQSAQQVQAAERPSATDPAAVGCGEIN